jgi:hypothetical protein
MAGEERFVEGDILDADQALERVHLDDTIHEQERVPVGQELHDLLNVHDDFAHIVNLLLLFSSLDGAAGVFWRF